MTRSLSVESPARLKRRWQAHENPPPRHKKVRAPAPTDDSSPSPQAAQAEPSQSASAPFGAAARIDGLAWERVDEAPLVNDQGRKADPGHVWLSRGENIQIYQGPQRDFGRCLNCPSGCVCLFRPYEPFKHDTLRRYNLHTIINADEDQENDRWTLMIDQSCERHRNSHRVCQRQFTNTNEEGVDLPRWMRGLIVPGQHPHGESQQPSRARGQGARACHVSRREKQGQQLSVVVVYDKLKNHWSRVQIACPGPPGLTPFSGVTAISRDGPQRDATGSGSGKTHAVAVQQDENSQTPATVEQWWNELWSTRHADDVRSNAPSFHIDNNHDPSRTVTNYQRPPPSLADVNNIRDVLEIFWRRIEPSDAARACIIDPTLPLTISDLFPPPIPSSGIETRNRVSQQKNSSGSPDPGRKESDGSEPEVTFTNVELLPILGLLKAIIGRTVENDRIIRSTQKVLDTISPSLSLACEENHPSTSEESEEDQGSIKEPGKDDKMKAREQRKQRLTRMRNEGRLFKRLWMDYVAAVLPAGEEDEHDGPSSGSGR